MPSTGGALAITSLTLARKHHFWATGSGFSGYPEVANCRRRHTFCFLLSHTARRRGIMTPFMHPEVDPETL